MKFKIMRPQLNELIRLLFSHNSAVVITKEGLLTATMQHSSVTLSVLRPQVTELSESR
jgi:hypothetical protein